MSDSDSSTSDWSAAELKSIVAVGDVDYPDAFWRRLSTYPKLDQICVGSKDLLNFLPYLFSESDNSPDDEDDDDDSSDDEDSVEDVLDTDYQEPPTFPFPAIRHIHISKSYGPQAIFGITILGPSFHPFCFIPTPVLWSGRDHTAGTPTVRHHADDPGTIPPGLWPAHRQYGRVHRSTPPLHSFGFGATNNRCDALLEPILNALRLRRALAQKLPAPEIETLQSLTFLECESAPNRTLVSAISSLVHQLVWKRRAPQPIRIPAPAPAPMAPQTRQVSAHIYYNSDDEDDI
ncbi:hypothetical protein NMY22_g17272 [Coprinellus aureogranulatus]|nr:hypothetical protein NMY22_g17272 [Coprinellus aureogranulatus]